MYVQLQKAVVVVTCEKKKLRSTPHRTTHYIFYYIICARASARARAYACAYRAAPLATCERVLCVFVDCAASPTTTTTVVVAGIYAWFVYDETVLRARRSFYARGNSFIHSVDIWVRRSVHASCTLHYESQHTNTNTQHAQVLFTRYCVFFFLLLFLLLCAHVHLKKSMRGGKLTLFRPSAVHPIRSSSICVCVCFAIGFVVCLLFA